MSANRAPRARDGSTDRPVACTGAFAPMLAKIGATATKLPTSGRRSHMCNSTERRCALTRTLGCSNSFL